MKKILILTYFMVLSTLAFSQTLPKGNVTQTMSAGRVVDGKELQLSDVSTAPGFTRGQGLPFSIMIVPKSDANTKEVEVVKARYYQGDVIRDVPLSVNQWNVTALVLLSNHADNQALFTNYRVFVGFGFQAE